LFNLNIGKVAAARTLLTLVFYGLRDGHIRCLARTAWASVELCNLLGTETGGKSRRWGRSFVE
jgi:hypothetical protein